LAPIEALPFFTAMFAAFLIAPPALRLLAGGSLARENYRGRVLACPLGVVIVAAALCALIPLAVAEQAAGGVLRPELGWIAVYVLGVAFLGLADDALADRARGWRGHAAALRRGELSTGALKAVGAAGLALYAMARPGAGATRFVLGAAVLVLATNAFNLLDLRPGRACKAFVVLGAGLTLGSGDLVPLWAVGLFAGPVLVVGLYDVRELGLLGDTGANAVGALAGAWLVLTLSDAGLVVALVVLVAITAYGEFRSISDLVDRTPGLRHLDSWGRPSDDTAV
jgi:UDP-N-acetylmuramyl pentapeptide phosphotransferase/UDP-N-acetylglucosamine-1-phosphate transferase